MERIFKLLVSVVALLCVGCEFDDTMLTNNKTYTIQGIPNAITLSNRVDVIVDKTLPIDQIYTLTNCNNFNRLTIEVIDGILHIDAINTLLGNERYSVYIPSLAYRSIKTRDGSDFTWEECNSDTLTIESTGGSDLKIKGTIRQLNIKASGGSDIDCGEFNAEDVTIVASGGSDIDVVANKTLSLTASGGSDIHITGNPQILLWDVSESSDVEFN